jgi:lipopolysaccharide/colanic/teichoic acid biosynthesis glycosyltransferase
MYRNSEEIFDSMPQELKDKFVREWKLETDEDPRITGIGKFLRRTSIDELPQLINIIRGDLSVVGPRPVVERELTEKYGYQASELLSIRPGLVGYWAAYERSNCSYDKRKQMELFYAGNPGVMMDARILAKSLRVVVSGRGAA